MLFFVSRRVESDFQSKCMKAFGKNDREAIKRLDERKEENEEIVDLVWIDINCV
jgi:hypothetical protein